MMTLQDDIFLMVDLIQDDGCQMFYLLKSKLQMIDNGLNQ